MSKHHVQNASKNTGLRRWKIESYQKLAENEPEKAEWAKNMIDIYYQKDLDKYESELAEMLEHNKKAKPIEEVQSE